MRLRSIAVAALAALTLAACSKDGGNDGNTTEDGVETSFSFTLTIPQALTRATQDGTPAENAIGDYIYVYVFNPDGSLLGYEDFTRVDFPGDFTPTGTSTYTLNKKIKTYSGYKKIYVAANLEHSVFGTFATTQPANEAALLDVIDVHANILNYDFGNLESIAMIGMAEERLDMEPVDNVVSVGLDRAVSRVITTMGSGLSSTMTADWSAANAGDLIFEVEEFFVVQDAYKSHFAQKYATNSDGVTIKTSYLSTASSWDDALHHYGYYVSGSAPYNIDYQPVASYDAATTVRQDVPGFYIGENVAKNENDVARYGTATYAYIKTQMELAKSAVIEDNGSGDELVYNGSPISAGSDFVLIRGEGFDDIICENSTTVRTAITDYLQQVEGIDNTDIYQYEYPEGYVYFRVFLGRNKSDAIEKYNVYRNEFFHVLITGVDITPGDFGTTYPGRDDDPETPIDPNEDNGKNPNPPDEEDETPLEEGPATLRVVISVNPWEYVPDDLELGEDPN
ncbi:MAG: Mfa1 family fimbria major subunit [Rikenellaceae bacterium]|nr:Mfa1 family fimbria major subunit [Rikenellaceae bacterium]